jgi:aconitate decarboxylase
MAHALDFDNTWYPLNHPTSPTLPAILAIAEHDGFRAQSHRGDRRRVRSAGRVRLAATGMETGSGFHKPGMTGTSRRGRGRRRAPRSVAARISMAFGLAGSRWAASRSTRHDDEIVAFGPRARAWASNARCSRAWAGRQARTSSAQRLLRHVLRGTGEPQRLIEGFAQPLRMIDPASASRNTRATTSRTGRSTRARAAREHAIDPQTRSTHVESSFPRFDYVNRPFPETGLDGKFSVQYTTAVALLDGEVTIDSFTNERRFAPDVEALLRCVKLTIDDSIPGDFDRMHTVVTVQMKNGARHERRVDRLSGWIGEPLTREQPARRSSTVARGVRSTQPRPSASLDSSTGSRRFTT